MDGFEILSGAVDLHMHPGPARKDRPLLKRRLDFLEAARYARDVGMKAIVFKPLEFPTIDRAYAAEKAVPGIKVFGGIVLDYAMGGLNPEAVEIAIHRGAKIIWMPVFDSLHTRKMSQKETSGIYKQELKEKNGLTIFDDTGQLSPEVKKILDLIASAGNVVLDTAHLSPQESLVLIEEAKKRGIKNVLVTHPEAEVIGATEEQEKEMAMKGAYLNFCYNQTVSNGTFGERTKRVAQAIKNIGASHCCLSTDSGNNLFSLPIEGLRSFTQVLMALGIDEQEIDLMIRQNPSRILDLQ